MTTFILADPEVITPPDQSLWTNPTMVDEKTFHPTFSPHEVARCFFGRSTSWLRKHMQARHNMSAEFGKVEPLRRDNDYQAWRLYDIERLAYAFHEHGVIRARHLGQVINLVKIQAQMHDYLK